jgi:hypothetical protein
MAFATRHNGGLSQTNFNFLQAGGEYPFINCLKTAQYWTYDDNSGQVSPSELDSNGYPTTITHGGVYTRFYVPPQSARSGNYKVTWTGNGTISKVTAATGSTSVSGFTFTPASNGSVDLGISAIGSPAISDLKVYHEDDQSLVDAGEIFGAKFKARLAEANFGVYRFLNWQAGNTTNATTYASLKPASYAFYEGSEFRPGIYAGVATLAGSAYSVAAPSQTVNGAAWSGLAHGTTVSIHFGSAISSACTLNVGGTGAKNILDSYSTALSGGGNSYPVTGKLATLIYDSTLDSWIKWGGDLAIGSSGIVNGCPPSICFQLCAEMGAQPWFVAPHLSMDPVTDLMSSIATYCRDNGPPWMKTIYEGPNELWNTAGGFFQTVYATSKATAYGWSGYNDWYGKIISTLGQAISSVYSADRSRYDVVCGIRTGAGQSNGVAEMDQRLISAEYVADGGSAGYNWVTAIACATYWNPYSRSTQTETDLATEYASASTQRKTEIANSYADGCIVAGSRADTLPALVTIFANWKAWALGMSTPIRQMFAYEGCYTPDYEGTANIDTLRYAAKSSPNMGAYLTSVYYSMTKLTDSTFTAKYPSNFILGDFTISAGYAGGLTSYAWAVFLGDIWAATTPQWDAICRYNATIRATNLRVRMHG